MIDIQKLLQEADEIAELDKKRTQGEWHIDKALWRHRSAEYQDVEYYTENERVCKKIPANGNKHNDSKFMMSAPRR